jgi:hypothetical protein
MSYNFIYLAKLLLTTLNLSKKEIPQAKLKPYTEIKRKKK